MQNTPSSNPRDHVAHVKRELGELIHHLREDVRKFDEPKAQALFETSAEVLKGLETAFTHYEEGKEPGMKR
jgi:hypothetical protein